MTVIYNCHSDGLDYRITKFEDGNPTSSYLCSTEACECPAGVRPTCRHRQMLLAFLKQHLVNTPWFVNWDGGGYPCDFEGRAVIIEHNPLAEQDTVPVPEALHDTAEGLPPRVQVFGMDDLFGIHNAIADAVGGPHVKLTTRTTLPPVKWRRM
jgi:hypothetical protein